MNIKEFSVGVQLEIVDFDQVMRDYELRKPRDEVKKRLEEFRRQIGSKDVVFFYSADQEIWDNMMGSEGYIIVRGEQVVDDLILRMN